MTEDTPVKPLTVAEIEKLYNTRKRLITIIHWGDYTSEKNMDMLRARLRASLDNHTHDVNIDDIKDPEWRCGFCVNRWCTICSKIRDLLELIPASIEYTRQVLNELVGGDEV